MKPGRLEAFSDGVLAIIITIMVLQISVPKGNTFASLQPLLPKLLSYFLSFVYVGIYWNNHHHLFQAIEKVNGNVLWANLVLLFTLSLIPFSTDWLGENSFGENPAALYGINLFLCAVAFAILEYAAIRHEGASSKIARALKNKNKEIASVVLYIVGITFSFFLPVLSIICYAVVALIWIIPDKRIEKEF